MTQKEFNEISKRYLEGNSTVEEDAMLDEWYQKQKFPSFFEDEPDAIENRIWNKIALESGIKRRIQKIWFLRTVAAMAAVVVITLAVVFIGKEKIGSQQRLVALSELPEEREFTLPDGTRILLDKDSEVSFGENFNETERAVNLKGSAFFDVKHDSTKPFRIYSGDLVTEVLGTSFQILRNDNNASTEVKVLTGKVSVFNRNKTANNKVVLKPNQKAVFSEVSGKLIQALVENPEPLKDVSAEKKTFIFKNAPLKEVAETFNSVYGIDFRILNQEISECKINADLEGLSMYTKLELICKSIEASYEVEGTTVFIKGVGCN